MPSAVSKTPHVLILGAGLGGLALGQALRKQGVSFEIFERDADIHARFQGWAIALHMSNKELTDAVPNDLPPLSVTSHLRPLDLQAQFVMYHKDGGRTEADASRGLDLIRANRARLREWLATNIDVKWGKTVSRIEETEDLVTLHFSDGTVASGDVLVGADGVHSQVRRHLMESKDVLNRLPMGFVAAELTLTKEQYERQFDIARSAYILMPHDDKNDNLRAFIGLNRISDDASTGRYFWFINWADQEAAKEGYWTASASKKEMYDCAMEATRRFDPKLTEIFKLTKPDDMMARPLVIRDMMLTELPNRRVTLLGDAAHPMSPFRGEGGNNAFLDSVYLSRALSGSDRDTLLPNLKAYQDEMLDRGSKAVWESRVATRDNGLGTSDAWNYWAEECKDGKDEIGPGAVACH